ncbi:MAG: ribonuclease III domain-containing protein [Acidaminococcaceae bacterium]|nr:ribonuclease III domain-containing protein [Acidaminococcaceae bacterium]
MKFEQYSVIKKQALAACGQELTLLQDPKQLNPVILAYIGDAVFSLYVRMRLLPTSAQVRVLHNLGAQMVSAVMQAKAMDILTEELTPEEAAIARRGRNTKSTVPKSASVREYRQGTAWEALVGWLFLSEQEERLGDFLDKSFAVIQKAMQDKKNK